MSDGATIKVFLLNFATNFLHFFSFLAQKTLIMKISTSVWNAQHPNAYGKKKLLKLMTLFERRMKQLIVGGIFSWEGNRKGEWK